MYTYVYIYHIMKNKNALPLEILKILHDYPDEEHLISMAELSTLLEAQELPSTRLSIYRAIETLQKYNFHVQYKTHKYTSGYYLPPYLDEVEQFILLDYLKQLTALSKDDIQTLYTKLLAISNPLQSFVALKQTNILNHNIRPNIQKILQAIQHFHPISFYYFDYTISKQKKYRKNKKQYILMPYAITSYEGKYYCVLYSDKYHSFSNYRLDKMENINEIDEATQTVAFDLEQHLQTSMKMYAGKSETVTLQCDSQMANTVIDEFSSNMIIRHVDENSFMISIKTAVTPTFINWIMLFYDRVKVIEPTHLKDQLIQISKVILHTYQKEVYEPED